MSSLWLGRSLLHLIMSGLADTGGKSGRHTAMRPWPLSKKEGPFRWCAFVLLRLQWPVRYRRAVLVRPVQGSQVALVPPPPSGWQLAVGGGWWLAVGGPLGRSLRPALNKKKNPVP